MKNIIATTLLILSLNALAGTLPTTKADFCTRFQDSSVLSTYSSETSNLMAFKNQGGLFNGGVCWWHSRFQRNILYLSIFRPDLKKPTASEVRALIKEIRAGESVVTIPGFANFSDFSTAYTKEILAELESWQLYDGVILGSWIDGLKGDTKVASEELQKMMATTFKYIEVSKKIAYQKLQIKGITSHAWLMIGMKPGPNGFEIGLIDSNNPRMSENYSYKIGDESFFEKGYGNFVPYLEFTREEERLTSVGKSFCGVKGVNDSNPSEWAKGYEQDLAEAKSHLK
ncbi:MAG: hypothetical protein H7177_13085 [Rhizobacter sp.]|nr:hypothetical protein [Bacteriovorax sp.]